MRVLILGGDGYLGWPTAMSLAAAGHEVAVADNYLRRTIASATDSDPLVDNPRLPERAEVFHAVSGHTIAVHEGDVADRDFLGPLIRDFAPDAVVHYAEQPSAPYSMMGRDEATLTLNNNLGATMNLIWCLIEHAPNCHLVKLGTMGEYGTPNIDIEEGWIDIEHKGRSDRFLFPRQAGSLYHTTKVLDTDLLWFYVRMHKLRVTDLMQGPVYGMMTPESALDPRLLPNFNYDDIFGTVVNRFLVQAVKGIPLTVYGQGGQTRGYLNLNDTLQCLKLAIESPADPGELRIFNQFTETFSVNELAERVQRAAQQLDLAVTVEHLPNPRQEAEDHYYNPAHHGLLELGLEPHFMSDEILRGMLEVIRGAADRIETRRVLPRVRWAAKQDGATQALEDKTPCPKPVTG